jgi:hypothetical protein
MTPCNPIPSLCAFFGLALLLLTATPGSAAWPTDPGVDVPLCTATDTQTPSTMIPDGAGGAIVVWEDYRSGTGNVYAQRVDAAGVVQWTAGGVELCTEASWHGPAGCVSDGAGGVIVCWWDFRTGDFDIYAQHVSAAGTVLWAPDGVALCTAPGTQYQSNITSDGAGGAIVTWQDGRSGGWGIYAQRVDGAGVVHWTPDGVALCTVMHNQQFPSIVPDGAGGAIVAWNDDRNGNSDIYAQRVGASGALQWTTDGMALCTAGGDQVYPVMTSDGSGGAIASWQDYRGGEYDIYAQRVGPSGTVQWTADGVALCTITGVQTPDYRFTPTVPTIVSDGAGGAVVTWQDSRAIDQDIYAQRVNGAGTPLWTANGVAVCTAPGDQIHPSIAPDGSGGGIVAWIDSRSDIGDIYAQRVNGGGVVQWTPNGAALCTAPNIQYYETLVSDGAGGAIVTWGDYRVGNWDVYAQRIDRSGHLGSESTIAPVPPELCITPLHPCVTVPVVFARADATPVRGYHVTFTLSGNLALCGAGIQPATYLSSVNPNTNFHVTGSYPTFTVDEVMLGLPCGATGSGTLFTIPVSSSSPGGTGSITINAVVVRGCDNEAVTAYPGDAASITIDNELPSPIASLTATRQNPSGHPLAATADVRLSWPAGEVEPGATVQVWRKGFGNYPEYDDPPGAGSMPSLPATPAIALLDGWTLTSLTTPGMDFTPSRDDYFYVAFTSDGCGNVSTSSNMTPGTLNYFLGDVGNGTTAGTGDNQVLTEDISLLGDHYGISLGDNDPYGYLDVGPTTTGYVDGRPLTDNRVDFEDLMMFAIDYSQVSKPRLAPVAAALDRLTLEVDAGPAAGVAVTARLQFTGTGRIQGISSALRWNPAVVQPVSVSAGALLDGLGGVVLSPAAGAVDVAVTGSGRGIAGEGTLASVSFRRLAGGDPEVSLASVDARDTRNRRVDLASEVAPPAAPVATALRSVAPNPFRGALAVEFGMATQGEARLTIHSVAGRLVALPVQGLWGAGLHHVTWNGLDLQGNPLPAGVYFARFTAGGTVQTRTIVLLK